MKGTKRIALMALTAWTAVGCARGASPSAAPVEHAAKAVEAAIDQLLQAKTP